MSEMNEQQIADDQELADVLGHLDQMSEEVPQEPEFSEGQDVPISPVLENLKDGHARPSPGSVCEGCTNSVWQEYETEVKCYCRVLFTFVTTTKEPSMLLACDGQFLNQEE